MNSLFVASLLFFVCLWFNPSFTSGKRLTVPKVKCYKVYKSDRNSCRKKISGRYTLTDCCEARGGAGYQISKSKKGKGKRKCLPCSTEENWSAWGEWTPCNSVCGPGISRRTRKCLSINGAGCPGRKSDKKNCVNSDLPHCPIHGGWSDWGNWSSCSVTCGRGIQLRFRSCTKPRPQYGGRDCKGTREDKQECQDTPNCPVHGGWGDWSDWSACSVTCGIGWRKRVKKCDNPKPKYGGKPCDPAKAIDRQSCDTYKKCGAESSGSGSGDDLESSGDGSGSGETLGSGHQAVEALDENRDDEEANEGSGKEKPTEEGTESGSDFNFSEPTQAVMKDDSK